VFFLDRRLAGKRVGIPALFYRSAIALEDVQFERKSQMQTPGQ
jgi:hypothetical protein